MNSYHRIPDFNTRCAQCSLRTYKAVPGQSRVPLDQINLVVISAYPGKAEEESGLSLAPSPGQDRDMGAGAFLRLTLEGMFRGPTFPQPFEDYVYFTNALKCAPREKTVLDRHRDTCRNTWLLRELSYLPPRVPLLLASSEAVKAILGLKESLNSNRNKVLYYESHPLVCTFNPIEVERGLSFLPRNQEDARMDLRKLLGNRKSLRQKDVKNIVETRYWSPFLPGSTPWLFKRDMRLIRQEVIHYLAS